MSEPISVCKLKDMENTYYAEALSLLRQLIAIPSFSREEQRTADLLETFISGYGLQVFRKANNVWVYNRYFQDNRPTILLNSHHDTVKPVSAYTLNPFDPLIKEGKLYGLGSNDAGGALVSLLMAFLHFQGHRDLAYNLVFVASAEEEISGTEGIVSVLPDLGKIDFAIVGEPTGMHPAIAEKGLLVLDCIASGRASHAAHENPDNAIVRAIRDIEWLHNYTFGKVSSWLGEVKMNVTMIESGTQHNVIPDQCRFTVDIRSTEVYNNQEILDIVRQHVHSRVTPRSLRLNPSFIPVEHPFVQAGIALGRRPYGSPTISDQALIPVPSLKLGPGDSLRSHTADEYLFLEELKTGISLYIKMLSKILII